MPLKSATFKKMKLSAANQAIGQCYIGLENRWMEFSVGATPKSTSVPVTSAPDSISLPRKTHRASCTTRKPTAPERSMLGDIISSLPCSMSLYAWGKYQIDPCG